MCSKVTIFIQHSIFYMMWWELTSQTGRRVWPVWSTRVILQDVSTKNGVLIIKKGTLQKRCCVELSVFGIAKSRKDQRFFQDNRRHELLIFWKHATKSQRFGPSYYICMQLKCKAIVATQETSINFIFDFIYGSFLHRFHPRVSFKSFIKFV